MRLCPWELDNVKVIWPWLITDVEGFKIKLSAPKLVDFTASQTSWRVVSDFWTSLWSIVFTTFHRQHEALQFVEMTAEMMSRLIRHLMDIIRSWMALNLVKINLYSNRPHRFTYYCCCIAQLVQLCSVALCMWKFVNVKNARIWSTPN